MNNLTYGDKVIIKLRENSIHNKVFNNKYGIIMDKELTKKKNFYNYPNEGKYVIICPKEQFNKKEKSALSVRARIIKDNDGIEYFVSIYIYGEEEIVPCNKKELLRIDLMNFAKTI